jgi:methylthioribose-1-phosphate isomerase
MRTIDWVDGAIELIDQTRLPDELVILRISTLEDLVGAISRLAVRGAPALGVAGAMGVALVAAAHPADTAVVEQAARSLRDARPTAVNLAWGVDRALARLVDGAAAVLAEAERIRDEDIAACASMARRGANLVQALVGARPVRVMTICNTGALAAVELGTALGVVSELRARGLLEEVLPLETRPLLQGARLTAWELQQMGAPFRLLVDSAAASVLARGLADIVLTGADRIARNGDTANKVGRFSLAVAASHAGVPFVVVVPESTVDLATSTGKEIPIEERSADEVTMVRGVRTAPAGTPALNPAFDVTPATLITAIVTDWRVIRLDHGETPASVALESAAASSR